MDLPRERLTLVLAGLVTVALYAGSLADPYVYQDANYQHLVSPRTWHAMSLALHLLNGLLLYAVATARSWAWPVLLVTLFWWAPLNVEAVAYGAGQPELRITACLLTLALLWTVCRWPIALPLTALPVAGLVSTKVGLLVKTGVLTAPALAQGVSWQQWGGWEASAFIGLLARWIVPVGLSVDHDVVHGAAIAQFAALALLGTSAFLLAWHWTRLPAMVRVGAAWVLILVAPRFALRLPLSILNEHHAYTLSPGFATITTWAVSRWA